MPRAKVTRTAIATTATIATTTTIAKKPRAKKQPSSPMDFNFTQLKKLLAEYGQFTSDMIVPANNESNEDMMKELEIKCAKRRQNFIKREQTKADANPEYKMKTSCPLSANDKKLARLKNPTNVTPRVSTNAARVLASFHYQFLKQLMGHIVTRMKMNETNVITVEMMEEGLKCMNE